MSDRCEHQALYEICVYRLSSQLCFALTLIQNRSRTLHTSILILRTGYCSVFVQESLRSLKMPTRVHKKCQPQCTKIRHFKNNIQIIFCIVTVIPQTSFHLGDTLLIKHHQIQPPHGLRNCRIPDKNRIYIFCTKFTVLCNLPTR